jgi:hypothetical protein
MLLESLLPTLCAKTLTSAPATRRSHSPSTTRVEQVSRIMEKVLVVVFATALLTATADAQLKASALTGAWRMTEMTRTGPNAETLKNPPGLLIFTGKYWSRMYVDSDQPRTQKRAGEKAATSELLAMWRPFVAASGTYEVSGNTLTCRALIAKNPDVMEPGNLSVYTFKIEGNTLTMTDTRNAAGTVASPRTFTYLRVE